jgi:hypothetical protein
MPKLKGIAKSSNAMIASIPKAAAISANAAKYSDLMIGSRGSIANVDGADKKSPSIRARATLPTTREKPPVLTRACASKRWEVRRASHSGCGKRMPLSAATLDCAAERSSANHARLRRLAAPRNALIAAVLI